MKPSTLPVICGAALAAISTAGLSHWWSVKQFVTAVDQGLPVTSPPVELVTPNAPATPDKPEPTPATPPDSEPAAEPLLIAKTSPTSTAPSTTPDPQQQAFFEALVSKLENLQNQNRDLLDQLAETNRDIMKLEFRVDTHSESFRPLPVTEERIDTSFEDEPGVLPPRAEPVMLPTHE
ncbi:MAG: hypothetical protein MUF13_13835 [Akkermansiaceae bacterium]|jgi:hypothetical protein|nr:hypothetical protein [Akkermansiaceae bacterium]